MTDFAEAIRLQFLHNQMMKDTVWCYPCHLGRGRTVSAIAWYFVGEGDLWREVPACRDCWQEQVQKGHAVGSRPVMQPAYLRVTREALGDPTIGTPDWKGTTREQ